MSKPTFRPSGNPNWKKGVSGNPKGRKPHPWSSEQRIVRKAVNITLEQLVQEYRATLTPHIPEVQEALVEKAKSGDMAAIREFHDVLGLRQTQSQVIPIQINFGKDREDYT